jgi:hypothetical protein
MKTFHFILDALLVITLGLMIWREMGQKGRQHIVECNDLDTQNDRLVEIYRSLADPQTRPRDAVGLLWREAGHGKTEKGKEQR